MTANFGAWKDLAIVEVAYFGVCFFVFIHVFINLIKHRISFKGPLLMFFLLCGLKIAAGACCIALLSSSTINYHYAFAYIVMNNISLGFFMRTLAFFLSFINKIHEREETNYTDDEQKMGDSTDSFIPTQQQQYTTTTTTTTAKTSTKPQFKRRGPITHLAGLVVDIVYYIKDSRSSGSTEVVHTVPATNNNNNNKAQTLSDGRKSEYELPMLEGPMKNAIAIPIMLSSIAGGLASKTSTQNTGKILMEVASVLYLGSLLLIGIVLVHKTKVYKRSVHKEHRIGWILILQMIMFVLITVRVIYSICSSFNFTGYVGSHASQFAQLYGDWRVYLGMAFAEECVVAAILLIIFELIIYRIR